MEQLIQSIIIFLFKDTSFVNPLWTVSVIIIIYYFLIFFHKVRTHLKVRHFFSSPNLFDS